MNRSTFLAILSLLMVGCDSASDSSVDASVEGTDAGKHEDAANPDADAAAEQDASVATMEDAASPSDAGDTNVDAGAAIKSTIIATVAVNDIALGDGKIYFSNDTMIGRVPVAGGAVEPFQAFSATGPNSIDADDTRIVWTEHNATTTFGAINSCPLTGCAGTPTAILNSGESTRSISLEGDKVVWISATNSKVLGAGGWGASSPGLTPVDIVVEGGDVFWLDEGLTTTPGAVYRCSATGTCMPTVINDKVGHPGEISVHGEDVVVLSDTGLFHMGRDGSKLKRLSDVGGLSGHTNVITDGTSVYWAIIGELHSCKIASCTAALIEKLTSPSEETVGLELDATHLYWGTFNAIRRFDL